MVFLIVSRQSPGYYLKTVQFSFISNSYLLFTIIFAPHLENYKISVEKYLKLDQLTSESHGACGLLSLVEECMFLARLFSIETLLLVLMCLMTFWRPSW